MEQREQLVTKENIYDNISVKFGILLARHGVSRPFEHVDFEVGDIQEDGSAAFIPKNFFTALLYEDIVFLGAIDGAKERHVDTGKFVWMDNNTLGFAELKK